MLCRATWDKHQGQSGGRKSHRQINSKSRYCYSNGKTTSIGQKQNTDVGVCSWKVCSIFIHIHTYVYKDIYIKTYTESSILILLGSNIHEFC